MVEACDLKEGLVDIDDHAVSEANDGDGFCTEPQSRRDELLRGRLPGERVPAGEEVVLQRLPSLGCRLIPANSVARYVIRRRMPPQTNGYQLIVQLRRGPLLSLAVPVPRPLVVGRACSPLAVLTHL